MGELIVHIAIFSIPFLVGWNILKKKRQHDIGDCFAAIVLLLIYLGISSFLRIVTNEDLPPYAVTNEGFMFYAEKTYGIENFYNTVQKKLQACQKKDNYVNKYPQWRYLSIYSPADEQSEWFCFNRTREDRLPLSLEIKSPEKEHFSYMIDDNEAELSRLSFWNDNMRTGINDAYWSCNFKRFLVEPFDLFAVLLSLFCSVGWIFPLAATAYKSHSKWLFYGLWMVVLALYIMNFSNWSQQVPALQYEKYDPQTAVAEVTKPENISILQKLLKHPTAVVEKDKAKTIIDVPLLCSGNFFNAKFLCWDLGKSTYLYYSTTDLIEIRLLTARYAKIYSPKENFYLVSYPDFPRASNRIWWQFVIIQTIAGSLWLGIFIMALKNRREEKETQEGTEQ